MSDDFCIIHGYDHMRSQMGNPIPFCEACESERCPCGEKPKGSCAECVDYPLSCGHQQ